MPTRRHSPARRHLLGLSGRLGFLALASAIGWPTARAATPAAGQGSVTMARGQVFVNGQRATIGTPVAGNAEIRTGSTGLAAFHAGGDAHVLKPNTTIVIRAAGNGFTDQLRLLGGSLLSAWGRRPPGQQARMLTRTATIGIRGTVTDANDEGVTLLEGEIEVQTGNGTRQTVRTAPGQQATRVDANGNTSNSDPSLDNNLAAALLDAASEVLDDTQTNRLLQSLETNAPGFQSGGSNDASPS